MLRSLRHYTCWGQSQGHHTIDRLEEREREKRRKRKRSTIFLERTDEKRALVNQTNIGTVSRATLGKLLRDGVESIWAFPSVLIPS